MSRVAKLQQLLADHADEVNAAIDMAGGVVDSKTQGKLLERPQEDAESR